MDYPTQSDLEACLNAIASQAGDRTRTPFRVDLVRLHGKPPMYSVTLKSADKERLRQQIGRILSRPFALGTTSFMLSDSDAAALVRVGQSSAVTPKPPVSSMASPAAATGT